MAATEHRTPRVEVKRRAFVAGAGTAMIGVGALTAACGAPAGSTAGGPTSATGAATPTPAPTTAPTPAPPTAAAPTAAAKPPATNGVALGTTSAVPVGGGAVFAAQKVVVTQPQAGRYVGLSAVCTHQGCVVADVQGGTINCPCHGSRYRLDGSVAQGPAKRALAPRPVTVVGDELKLG